MVSLRHQRAPIISAAQSRADFLAALLTITGDTRMLWLPAGTDTTTSLDQSLNGRTLTHNVSLASRLSRQGRGYKVTFNGTSHFVTTPDTDNLSFNGTTDQAFSILMVANITDTAAERVIVSKSASALNTEYYMAVSSADKLQLLVRDVSQTASCIRTSSPSIVQGAMSLVAASYDGVGDNAADGMTLYQNGAGLASTASNNSGGTYVDMENGAWPVEIGTRSAGAASFLPGEVALVVVCQKNLSASEHWAIWQLIKSYFNL